MESNAFQFVAVAVPDHDIVRLDSGLLQPLTNGFDELKVAGQSASSKCIHFQSHRLTRADQLLPCLDRIIAVEKSLHGTIQEAQHPARIHRGAHSAQHGIARDHNPGFRERRSLFCCCEQSHPAACAQNRSARETLLQKIPPTGAAHCAHKGSPGNPRPAPRISLWKGRGFSRADPPRGVPALAAEVKPFNARRLSSKRILIIDRTASNHAYHNPRDFSVTNSTSGDHHLASRSSIPRPSCKSACCVSADSSKATIRTRKVPLRKTRLWLDKRAPSPSWIGFTSTAASDSKPFSAPSVFPMV